MSKSYFANILGRLTALGLLGFMVSGCAVVPGRDLGSPVSLAEPTNTTQPASATQVNKAQLESETQMKKTQLESATQVKKVQLESATQVNKAQLDSATQIVPHSIYMETTEGKAVSVSSEVQAKLNGCTNMQRYRIRSNTDFLSTLHLFKYRAALMGAKRIVVIQHVEMDRKEFFASSDMHSTHTREGTTLENSSLFTSLTADLYDCKG